MLRIKTVSGLVDVPLARVQSMAIYLPAANMGHTMTPVTTLTGDEARAMVGAVVFDTPFQEGNVSGLRSSVLVITWEDDRGNAASRSFHVYNERLLQDDSFRDTYYNATSDFTAKLREILGGPIDEPFLPVRERLGS